MKEFSLSIPGFTIACKSTGQPENPPMLALHGWLDNANSFDLIAPLFAKHFHFIAIDLPGHGLSSHLPKGCHYHFIDGIGCIRDIIHALGYQKVHLLGHSMGACLASLTGGVLGMMTESLFLIEGLGPLSAPAASCADQLHHYFHHHHKKEVKLPRPYDSLEAAIQARSKNGYLSPQFVERLCQRGIECIKGKYYWRHDKRLQYTSVLRLTEEMVLSCLQNINIKTALITASDGFDFDGTLEKRMAIVKNLHHYPLQGGHHIHMENPEKIEAIAQTFYHYPTEHPNHSD